MDPGLVKSNDRHLGGGNTFVIPPESTTSSHAPSHLFNNKSEVNRGRDTERAGGANLFFGWPKVRKKQVVAAHNLNILFFITSRRYTESSP